MPGGPTSRHVAVNVGGTLVVHTFRCLVGLGLRGRVSPNPKTDPNSNPNPGQVLLESMYHLPSWSARGVRHCLVTEDTVLRGAMSELYPQPQVEAADDPEEPPAAALG